MDHCDISAGVFHEHADLYREKFMDLTLLGGYLFTKGVWLYAASAESASQSKRRIQTDDRPDCHRKEILGCKRSDVRLIRRHDLPDTGRTSHPHG